MMTGQTFRERYGSWAVVAGASEGLGAAFARSIAAQGVNLILLARRADALQATADTLRTAYNVQVQTVPLDLASPDVQAEFERCIAGREIGLLVYNAAYSKIGSYEQMSVEDKLRHIAVNCESPVILSSMLVPQMVERKRGGLIFMASVVGMSGTELLSMYAATKAFNINLASSLWQELQPQGVDVLAVIAGAVATSNYEKTQPAAVRFAPAPQDPQKLAENALNHLGKGSPLWTSSPQVSFVSLLLNRLLTRAAAVRFMSNATRQTYAHFKDT